jgi:acetyl-CoA carboxylase carboxyl transferase subunit beta
MIEESLDRNARRPASAAALLDRVADPGSFHAWDDHLVSNDPLSFVDTVGYAQRLKDAARRAGTRESIVTGSATIRGFPVVLIVGEFAFLAGTMGVAAAERVVRAFERASESELPVIGMPVSGGTRMQEGTPAFVQMVNCAAAVRRFRDSGGLYVAYLRDPTLGGVLASWGALADVTFAEPGALIGLTGPRVMAQLSGEAFPTGVQVAENLHAHGLVDDVVPTERLAERLAEVLDVAERHIRPWEPAGIPPPADDSEAIDVWRAIEYSRRTDRPGIRELLAAAADGVVRLRGDGGGSEDAGCLVALTRLCGVPVVIVGHERPPGQRGASLGAAGHRKARRGMALAEELGVPLVTIIDTAGAAMTRADEESGLAAEIARCLATLTGLRTPTLSLLLGEGSGGGAIALLPCDRVLAVEHAWLAPIAPEGASSILFRSRDQAPDLARKLGVGVGDLRRSGLVDVVMASPSSEGASAAQAWAAVIGTQLHALVALPEATRLSARTQRYRAIGQGTVISRDAAGDV